MKPFARLIFFLFLSVNIYAQDMTLGSWRDELPYSKLTAITESDDYVYAATPYSILSYQKKEGILERVSKVNGLSDFGIGALKYNSDYKTLLVAYTNANIDLIKDGRVVNMSDIYRKTILGDKTIYSIYFQNQYAYLSCGFGIVVVDLEREEIKDTYYIGENGDPLLVYDLTVLNGLFYAATKQGIYVADITNSNLANYNNWTKLMHLPAPDATYNHLVVFQDKVIVNRLTANAKDQLFAITENTWSEIALPINDKVLHFDVSNDNLITSHKYSLGIFNADLSFNRKIYTYGEGFTITLQPSAVLASTDGNYYIADRAQGLVVSSDLSSFFSFILNGPRTASVFDLAVSGSKAVVASGGRDDSFSNLYMKEGVFTYENAEWHSFYSGNTPAMDTAYDFVCAAINPNNASQFAVGSWGKGLYTFNENGFDQAYGTSNSSLTGNIVYGHILRIGGVAYDSKGNLWVASSASNALLHKQTPEGEWTAFEFGSWSASPIRKMFIDSQDRLWMILRHSEAYQLFAFDETQAVNYQLKGLSTSAGNGNIPGSYALSMAFDLEGALWVGTDQGVGVIYNPGNVFTGGDYDAQQIVVERDGYAQYLLESEKVRAIAVDGANRKWIGTERAGIFLLSADGQEELLHFTAENSPLYSNNITSIGINDDGEVFIGTAGGLIVYKGTATSAKDTFSQVYAYPNPVRPDYVGPIAIKGLTRDAFVKITDVSGRLVNELRSEGGQAIWSGENFDGERVKTGVYLVFIANTDGTESMVTKVLFIH